MNSSGTNAVKTTAERSNLRNLVQIGMLGAVSVVLMMFEIPLFFAPSFYKIDLSEIPVLIGTFAMGPVAGMFIELIKVVLHMLFKGSSTAGVGDFANFLIGCAMIVPAGLIYQKKKSKKSAVFTATANNVLLFTNYDGDPEVAAAGSGVVGSSSVGIDYCGVPATASFAFGVNLTF